MFERPVPNLILGPYRDARLMCRTPKRVLGLKLRLAVKG